MDPTSVCNELNAAINVANLSVTLSPVSLVNGDFDEQQLLNKALNSVNNNNSQQLAQVIFYSKLNLNEQNMILNVTRDFPLEYALVIFGYIMPFLLLITFITNTLVVMVLAQPHMKNPTNTVLFSMAIVDLMTLLSPSPWYFYTFTLGYHKEFLYPPVACYLHQLMTDVIPIYFHTSSNWLALLLASQRYIYVCQPTLARTWCTVPRVKKHIVYILIVAFLHQSGRLFDLQYTGVALFYNSSCQPACQARYSDWVLSIDLSLYYITYYTFRIVFVFAIPSIALITLNCLLFRALRRADTNRLELMRAKLKPAMLAAQRREQIKSSQPQTCDEPNCTCAKQFEPNLNSNCQNYATCNQVGVDAKQMAAKCLKVVFCCCGIKKQHQQQQKQQTSLNDNETNFNCRIFNSSSLIENNNNNINANDSDKGVCSCASSWSSPSPSNCSPSSVPLNEPILTSAESATEAKVLPTTEDDKQRPVVHQYDYVRLNQSANGTTSAGRSSDPCVQSLRLATAGARCTTPPPPNRTVRRINGQPILRQRARNISGRSTNGCDPLELSVCHNKSQRSQSHNLQFSNMQNYQKKTRHTTLPQLQLISTQSAQTFVCPKPNSVECNRTTMMLIVVVSVFLLVEVPVALSLIIHVAYNTLEVFQFVDYTWLNYIKMFTNFLIVVSYPINFTIYCSMSRVFRQTFRDLFMCNASSNKNGNNFTDATLSQRYQSNAIHYNYNQNSDTDIMTRTAPSLQKHTNKHKTQAGVQL